MTSETVLLALRPLLIASPLLLVPTMAGLYAWLHVPASDRTWAFRLRCGGCGRAHPTYMGGALDALYTVDAAVDAARTSFSGRLICPSCGHTAWRRPQPGRKAWAPALGRPSTWLCRSWVWREDQARPLRPDPSQPAPSPVDPGPRPHLTVVPPPSS